MADKGLPHHEVFRASVNVLNSSGKFPIIHFSCRIHHFSGKQVQLVHVKMTKQSRPELSIPVRRSYITIRDVPDEAEGEKRNNMIIKCSNSVWQEWKAHHEYIRQIAGQYP